MERTISRRRFVRGAAIGAGLVVLGDPLLARSARAVPTASDIAFTQGVASGEPAANGITLWTKLDGLEAPSRLTLEVSTDPGFASTLLETDVLADPAFGGSARTRLEGGPLLPGEQYWYRFTTGEQDSPVGRFRTARPADSMEPVKVAFFSCQEYIAGYYYAHQDLAAQDDVDLVVCLGDYIYEKGFAGTASVSLPVRQDRSATETGETETLEEYRAKYALYHSDPALLEVRRKFPFVAIWDDHEVEDNYASTAPGGAAERRRLPFLERRGNGYQAHYEAMPRVRGTGDRDRTYGSINLGAAEIFLLDTRQFRTDQPCDPTDSALAPFCGPWDYNRGWRTMLGGAQKAWLKDRLVATPAPWKLIANQVMMMSLDSSPGWPLNPDSWDGYGAERAELIDHLTRNGVKDVSFITGDIHTFFAGAVSRTGRAVNSWAGRVDGARATEFVCGSITSPGIVDRLASRESDRRAVAAPIDGLVLNINRHMAYSNQAYKGYGIVTAAPSELTVEYRAVRDTRSLLDTSTFSLATFRVPRGIATVERTSSAYPLAPRRSGPLPPELAPTAAA